MPLQQYGGSYPYTSSNKQGHTAVNDYCMAVGCWQVPKQTDGVRTPTDTTVQRVTVTGLTHNIVTSLPMSFCGSDEDCSMGGAVDALSSVDVACTQTLFYFSFRSFQKHRRARERVNKYPCSRDFEEKIEGL